MLFLYFSINNLYIFITKIISRCMSWKILSINWLNIARTNIEPKYFLQVIENGVTHYYIAYCIFLLRLFHQNSFFLIFFKFFCILCFFNTKIQQIYRFFSRKSTPTKEKRTGSWICHFGWFTTNACHYEVFYSLAKI